MLPMTRAVAAGSRSNPAAGPAPAGPCVGGPPPAPPNAPPPAAPAAPVSSPPAAPVSPPVSPGEGADGRGPPMLRPQTFCRLAGPPPPGSHQAAPTGAVGLTCLDHSRDRQ